jgi:hypothetical protein
MNLSKNLSLKEATKSVTAIRKGIDNHPDHDALMNLIDIANDVFQPLRDHFNVPIGISSGYRSKELNRAIGGSLKSQHTKGEALDIDADIYGQITNKQVFEYIKDNLEFDQLIWEFGDDYEPAWVHVSYKKHGENRRDILFASKKRGATVYESYT